jgi:hypothetical protein
MFSIFNYVPASLVSVSDLSKAGCLHGISRCAASIELCLRGCDQTPQLLRALATPGRYTGYYRFDRERKLLQIVGGVDRPEQSTAPEDSYNSWSRYVSFLFSRSFCFVLCCVVLFELYCIVCAVVNCLFVALCFCVFVFFLLKVVYMCTFVCMFEKTDRAVPKLLHFSLAISPSCVLTRCAVVRLL